jgi:hypothetical protein
VLFNIPFYYSNARKEIDKRFFADLKIVGVRVGEHNLAKETDCEVYENGAAYICAEKYQDLKIAEVYPHPDYSATTLRNDIALIR